MNNMDDIKILKDQLITDKGKRFKKLLNKTLPPISLPNQDGYLLRLNRYDTYRLVLYFYS